MRYKDTIIRTIAELCRLLIGGVFIFSGLVKAVDPVGFALKIEEYLASFGLEGLQAFSSILSFNIIAVEFALGVCILMGVYRRYSTFLVLLFMAFMTPLTLYLALFDPVSDCGCFGDAVIITNWETFYKNVVLLAASIFIFIYNQRIFSFFTHKAYWFVGLFAYLFCIGFSYRNYYHLPIIDFRPYKIGANIPYLMSIPEDAPEDEYTYSFIYEKDGVKKEFGLNNYPADDPDWTFVESKTELVKEGYVPPITSFDLYNEEGDNLSEEILNNDQAVFLLILSKVEKANDERIDDINNVYDYAVDKHIPFYAVSGSSVSEIEIWSDRTGAEYPFLIADETFLKTIIRSNPGLLLLRSGTILKKWHYKDIPAEENIDTVINSYLEGKEDETHKQQAAIRNNLLTFSVPLLLVWMYDYFRNRRRKRAGNKAEKEDIENKIYLLYIYKSLKI